MTHDLDLEQAAEPVPIAWLEKSWEDPDAFWTALWAFHQGLMGTPGKSSPFSRYDFFHDLVVRNRDRKNPAMIWYDPLIPGKDPWHQLSFKDLERQAGEIAAAWAAGGVGPGKVLCILRHPGPEFLKHLAAGFKIGATLAFVFPAAETWMNSQLEGLDPDFISTDDMYLPVIKNWEEKVLSSAGALSGLLNAPDAKSHSYPSGQTAAIFLDPMSDQPFEPRAISSDLFFMGAIRDALVGLRLRPESIWAAPGFDPGLTQPSFMMAGLAAGSTFLHVDMDAVGKDPLLLTRYPLATLGITKELRGVLMEKPVGKVKIWNSWFRDPAQSSDMDVWDYFIKKQELEEIPASALVWNASLGGCILFSRRREGLALQNVLPLPGRRWQKVMPGGDDVPALDGFGLLSLAAGLGGTSESNTPEINTPENNTSEEAAADEFFPTPCFLAATYLEDIFVKLDLPSRGGVFYPGSVVEGIVRKVAGCRDALIVEIPITGKGVFSEFHLLIFSVRYSQADYAQTADTIRLKIELELGKRFLPDKIRFFPLVPRRDETFDVDRGWTASQYQLGWLDVKVKDNFFLGISKLRALITQ